MSFSTYRSTLLRLLDERGYIHQATDAAALDALAGKEVVSGYIGFDATAPSLHVGSLVQIMLLRRVQQAGHRPIVLMGGGTSKIGDPSFKDEARKLLTDEQIAANVAGIRRVFERFLTFGDGPSDAILLDNSEWLDRLEYIPFLREIGQHFSVNRMLSFDSVKLRLDREQSLSFLEFNYMILQGYDFLELYRRAGCRLQLGGSDQWGNIVNGVELTRRVAHAEVFGLTTPLVTTADGRKMGKTESGAVWLNADGPDGYRLSPYDYWQFWRNTADADVGTFLRRFTDVPLEEIARLEVLEGAEINDAKAVLATEATALLHGRDAAEAAAETARQTFSLPVGLAQEKDTAVALSGSVGGLPFLSMGEGIPITHALTKLGLTPSNKEAKRKVAEGAVRLDDVLIMDPNYLIVGPNQKIISLGKKKHGLLVP